MHICMRCFSIGVEDVNVSYTIPCRVALLQRRLDSFLLPRAGRLPKVSLSFLFF